MLLESSGHSVVYSLSLPEIDVFDAPPVPSSNLSLFSSILQLALPYARCWLTPSVQSLKQHLLPLDKRLVPDKCNRTPMEFVIGNVTCLLYLYTALLTPDVTKRVEAEYVESTTQLILLLCQINQRSVAEAFTQQNSLLPDLLSTLLSWFPHYPNRLSSTIAALLLIHGLIQPDAFTTLNSLSLPPPSP